MRDTYIRNSMLLCNIIFVKTTFLNTLLNIWHIPCIYLLWTLQKIPSILAETQKKRMTKKKRHTQKKQLSPGAAMR